MRPKVGKLELEDYDDFLKNPYCKDTTIKQLNQVIQMHGFIKIHKRPKKVLLEVLSKMKLQNPQRSTLNVKILPYGSRPTVDQVNHDLEALEWQECAVQSVETLNLTVEDSCHLAKTNSCDLPTAFTVTEKKRRSKRRKRIDYDVFNGGGAEAGVGVDDEITAFDFVDCVDHGVDNLLDQLRSGPLI